MVPPCLAVGHWIGVYRYGPRTTSRFGTSNSSGRPDRFPKTCQVLCDLIEIVRRQNHHQILRKRLLMYGKQVLATTEPFQHILAFQVRGFLAQQ